MKMSTTISRSTDATTVTPTLVLSEWQSADEPQHLVHQILGSADVVVSLRPAAPRTGTLRLLFWDAASAEEARRFHRAPAVFSTASDLAWVPESYIPTGPIAQAQQDNRSRWVLDVPFTELSL